MQSQTIGALGAALAKAQAKMQNARKDAENPYFKSRYADLASVWDACRGPLSENGLSVIQTTNPAPDGVSLVTTLIHSSGEWISGEMFAKPVKNDPQGFGSCLTYLRRYALSAMVGVAPSDGTDDDGNLASQPQYENHNPPRDIPVTAMDRLVTLCGSKEYELILRDYLRAVPSKSGVYGLQPDQELSDLSPELAAYIVSYWTKVKTTVDTWANSVPGAEMPDTPQSSWRDYKIHFSTKKYPTIKGMTMGEAWDNKDTHGWVIGTLLGFTAKGYQGKPPSPEDLALEAVCKQWRKENGKPEPTEEQ